MQQAGVQHSSRQSMRQSCGRTWRHPTAAGVVAGASSWTLQHRSTCMGSNPQEPRSSTPVAATSQATQALRCGSRACQSSSPAAAAEAAKPVAACRRCCQPPVWLGPAMMAARAAF